MIVTRLFSSYHSIVVKLSLVIICLAASSLAQAGIFPYGSFVASDFTYENVVETNLEVAPLFDAPILSGNSLTFSPPNFAAGGTGPQLDFKDSTITTIISAHTGQAIENVHFAEAGDYTLRGLPGGFGEVTVGAAFFIEFLEINNSATHPALLTLPALIKNMQFTTGAGLNGGEYARPGDDGTAVPWTGSVLLDIEQHLIDNGVNGKATKVKLRFDNALTALADATSIAFIKKKLADGVVVTTNIPEPTSLVLLGMCVANFAIRRR